MKLVQIVEGGTRLFVPRASLEDEVPPTSPVFFNPVASVNRDVSVAITEAVGGATFCDALAGVGSRGLRVANEVQEKTEVTLVDFNRESLRAARRSAKANGVTARCRFVCSETNTFLHSRYGRDEKFDFVDVDPFGTPAPYLQALLSVSSNGGVTSVTATDTAALCGVYPAVSRRRYSATPLNNHFHHETGVRILLNTVRRQAATLDRGIVALAAHSTRHYIRVYARVEYGAGKADATLANEGYVCICSSCHHVAGHTEREASCEKCGGKVRCAGPLWVGRLTDHGTVERAKEVAGREGLGDAERILGSISDVDSFPPWSYSVEGICSSLGIATVSDHMVRKFLSEVGFKSARQPFEKTGLKTRAPYEEVLQAVKRSRDERRSA